jgi:hypothetical protein
MTMAKKELTPQENAIVAAGWRLTPIMTWERPSDGRKMSFADAWKDFQKEVVKSNSSPEKWSR